MNNFFSRLDSFEQFRHNRRADAKGNNLTNRSHHSLVEPIQSSLAKGLL